MRRYSRFVHSAKIVLIALVIALTGLLLFYSASKDSDYGIRVDFKRIDHQGGDDASVMINPRFQGLDEKNQPFQITATDAKKLDEERIQLNQVNGDMTLQSGRWLSLSSNEGVMHRASGMLNLIDNVQFFTDDGYEFHTPLLDIDTNRRIALSNSKVKGQGPLGTLKAEGVRMEGDKQIITFKGRVYVVITLPAKTEGEKK